MADTNSDEMNNTGTLPDLFGADGSVLLIDVPNSNSTRMKRVEHVTGFIYETCGKKYRSATGLKEHITDHNAQQQYTCGQCQQRFQSKTMFRSYLLLHADERHSKTMSWNVTCSKCPKKYCHNKYLQSHVRAVHDGSIFKCDQCEKIYAFESGLQRHLRSTHTGQLYRCSMYNKTFSFRSNFIRHLKIKQ